MEASNSRLNEFAIAEWSCRAVNTLHADKNTAFPISASFFMHLIDNIENFFSVHTACANVCEGNSSVRAISWGFLSSCDEMVEEILDFASEKALKCEENFSGVGHFFKGVFL